MGLHTFSDTTKNKCYLAIHRYIDIMCNACLQYFKGGDIRKCGEMDTNAKL